MKLIDAEALVAQEEFFAKTFKGDFGEQVATHVIEVINDAPTVDAIPVEWLKNWNPKEWNDTGYQVMRRIIDDWEKRNETD